MKKFQVYVCYKMLFNVIVILLNYASAYLKIDVSFKIYCKDGFYLPWIPEAPKRRKKGTSGSAMTRPHSNTSCSASLWYGNLSDVFGQLRGGQSIQARQLVFQSYYRVLAYQFSNGSSFETILVEGCVMLHSLVHPFEIHSSFPK